MCWSHAPSQILKNQYHREKGAIRHLGTSEPSGTTESALIYGPVTYGKRVQLRPGSPSGDALLGGRLSGAICCSSVAVLPLARPQPETQQLDLVRHPWRQLPSDPRSETQMPAFQGRDVSEPLGFGERLPVR